MATLTNEDYREIRDIIATSPQKATFRSWGLSKQVWRDLLQAAETWFVNGFLSVPSTSFKTALQAAAGTMTNAQAIAVGKIWMHCRFNKDI